MTTVTGTLSQEVALDLPGGIPDEQARAGLADHETRIRTLEQRPDDDTDEEARALIAELLAADVAIRADMQALNAQHQSEILTLQARILAEEKKADDDLDDAARAMIAEDRARLAALEAAPTGGGGGGAALGVMTPFSSFAGANDVEKFNTWFAKAKAGWKGEVQFECRLYNCPVQWPLIADLRFVGTATRAGEWNNGTIINYTGPVGTSMWALYSNTGYSYPPNGVVRNICGNGVQFRAGLDRDFLPPAPAGYDPKYVQWYMRLHDCAWVGFRYTIKGYGDGLDLSGFSHFQGFATTPLSCGGAENKWFSGGGLVDSGNAAWKAADLPIIECALDKSTIGGVMLSAQANSYQLKVVYGTGTRCIGTEFDSSDQSPTVGYQVRFDGTAKTFLFGLCTFKGGQGIRGVKGATEIGIDLCSFDANRELARLEAGFSGVLKWGSSNVYGSCPKTIWVARGNQIINGDPRVEVKSLDGSLTGIRNPDGTYTTARNASGATVAF